MAFQISVELSHQCPLEEIEAHCRILDTNGFYRVWVPDTLVSPWEAWFAANLIAHHTRKIRIGIGVTNPYTRHPVVMAQAAASFQHSSNGRLAISMGKGISRFLEKAGIEQKETAVEECIFLLQRLLSGERVDLKGKAFHIQGIQLRTAPVQKRVPVFIAAVNRKSWEIAAQAADGVVTFWSPEAADHLKAITSQKNLLTAAMIPFTLTGQNSGFFQNAPASLNHLWERIHEIKQAGFDEAVIAYGDLSDLETIAQSL